MENSNKYAHRFCFFKWYRRNSYDIVKRLINSFLNNYQKEEKLLRNRSNFVFEGVDLLSYHIHKTSLKRGNSYIKSPEWIANKKATINPKNEDDKCFKLLHYIKTNLKTIQKEYQICIISFLMNTIRRALSFQLE